MCLATTKKETNAFKAKHPDENETIRLWKVYIVFDYPRRLESWVVSNWKIQRDYFPLGTRVDKPGVIPSNRTTNKISSKTGDCYMSYARRWEVHQGLHAFTTVSGAKKFLKEARSWNGNANRQPAIVCCHAKMKDFVAFDPNRNEIVFTEISVSTRNFRKATKKLEKKYQLT